MSYLLMSYFLSLQTVQKTLKIKFFSLNLSPHRIAHVYPSLFRLQK